MTLPITFNFRNTLGFFGGSGLPDTGSQWGIDASTHASEYPVHNQGVTYGWNADAPSFAQGRDRNSGQGFQFGGWVNSNVEATPIKFRVDLPSAGSYVLNLAFGDENYSASIDAYIFDNTTQLAHISGTTGGANQFLDAAGNNRTSPTDWTNNNASITLTFSTTTLLIQLGDGVSTNADIVTFTLSTGGPTVPQEAPAVIGWPVDWGPRYV